MGKSGSLLLVPLIIGCAQFMQQFDGNVIATALPAMADSLHEPAVRLNIAITSYLLTLAIFVPISGWVADKFGARPVFTLAIAVFTLASALCGMSHTLWEMVGARLLQGVGGAMMTPVGRAIVAKSVPKADLVTAMMYISLPGVLGPVLGPPVGGFIVTFASWRWIFLINIPIGMIGIILALLFIPRTKEDHPPSFDPTGFALTGIGLGSLMIGFETMGRGVVPALDVAAFLLAGLACCAVYVRHARRHAAPILDLKLLKFRTFATATGGGFFFYIGAGAAPFLIALLFQVGFGYSAFVSGIMSLVMALGSVVVRVSLNRMLRAVGFRWLLTGVAILNGCALICVSFFQDTTPYMLMVLVMIPIGFARSVQFTGLGSLSYAEIPTSSMSPATGFQTMCSQLFQSFGVGFGALMLQLSINYHHRPAITDQDIRTAFMVIGLLAFISALAFSRLASDAGAEISGNRPSRA